MRRWSIIALLLVFAACSKHKDVDAPAVLVPLKKPALHVDRAWTANVGGTKQQLRLGLGLMVDGDELYASGRRGDVSAYSLKSGHPLWRTRTKTLLGGGTAVGGGLVVVGSTDGDVVGIDSAKGQLRWHTHVNGEILAAPAVSPRIVIVRTVDGKLHGLSPADGHELWLQEQQVPRLSLRGTAIPVLTGDVVICGFDNGKVIEVNINDGSLVWEATVTPPHGKTELERLNDIDSAVLVSGQDVFVVGFQGKAQMLALDTGQVWWSHDASSYRGMALDDETIFMSTADGDLVALAKKSGAEIWRSKALAHRGLSAPVIIGDSIAVADYKGFVHWFDKATGTLVARVGTGGVRISNSPVVAGNTLVVVNDRGRITAFHVAAGAARRAASTARDGAG